MATLHDVARAAGVSVTTVSYVINNRVGHFSEATKKQVLAAMKEVGYVQNTVARSLVRKRTETIGILMSNLTDEPFARALRAAQRVLNAAGYDVIVTVTGPDPEWERQALANMRARRVDGVLFISASRLTNHSHLSEFNASGLPFVVVNRYLPNSAVEQVNIDNQAGTKAAVAHLAAQGHKEIGCLHMPLVGPMATRASIERLAGYRAGMLAAGLAIRPTWLIEGSYANGDFGVRSGYEQALALFSRERLTALVCTNDYLAIGAFRAAAELGLRTPEDLALTGHDNTAVARYYSPEITSVEQPIAAAATMAAERLLAVISGDATQNAEAWSRTLPTKLIVRASSLHRRN